MGATKLDAALLAWDNMKIAEIMSRAVEEHFTLEQLRTFKLAYETGSTSAAFEAAQTALERAIRAPSWWNGNSDQAYKKAVFLHPMLRRLFTIETQADIEALKQLTTMMTFAFAMNGSSL